MFEKLKYYNLLFILIILQNVLFAQKGYVVSGHVTDKTSGKPIYNVNIVEKNTKNGTTTNNKGFFFIKVNSFPTNLEFSHVVYNKVIVKCNNNLQINVQMQIKVDSLPEVNVSAHNIVNLVEKKLFDVVDYEFYNDNILLLTYSYKDIVNPWLIMINNNGDTLFRTPSTNDGNFYRDCLGNIHLVSKNFAYQVFVEENTIKLLYPLNPDTFYKILNPCVTVINSKYFLKQWSSHNQILSYSIANSIDSTKKEIKVISDERALRMLSDRNRFYSMGVTQTTDADLRFEEMCFFDPIFAPLLKLKDNIAIFNFVESKIEIYEENGNPIKQISINFNKLKGWKEEIFADEVTGKAYALFKVNGISKLCEVSLENGKIINEHIIPNFKYIENIKVRNNFVYFLYRINSPLELMKLYKMEI